MYMAQALCSEQWQEEYNKCVCACVPIALRDVDLLHSHTLFGTSGKSTAFASSHLGRKIVAVTTAQTEKKIDSRAEHDCQRKKNLTTCCSS